MSSELTNVPDNPMTFIREAIQKGMDVESMKGLFELKRQWDRDRAAEAFAEAIAEFQKRMPAVIKGNPVRNKEGVVMYAFANLDDIMQVAQPILSELGIAVTFSTKITQDKLIETTCHVRVGIHVEDTTVTLALPQIPNANDAQKAGGALAYGQRYSMKAALNIRVKGEDNDGATMNEYITPDQIDAIEHLLEERRIARGKPIDLKKFLAHLGVAADGSVKDIRTNRYDEAVTMLKGQIAEAKK